MQQNDYLQVGVITSTHGIKGEVKVFPTTDDPNRFRALKDVVLDTGKEQIPLEIEGVKFFKQYVIPALHHIHDKPLLPAHSYKQHQMQNDKLLCVCKGQLICVRSVPL